jgi:hypothetical protein
VNNDSGSSPALSAARKLLIRDLRQAFHQSSGHAWEELQDDLAGPNRRLVTHSFTEALIRHYADSWDNDAFLRSWLKLSLHCAETWFSKFVETFSAARDDDPQGSAKKVIQQVLSRFLGSHRSARCSPIHLWIWQAVGRIRSSDSAPPLSKLRKWIEERGYDDVTKSLQERFARKIRTEPERFADLARLLLSSASANVWQGFREKFDALAKEELQRGREHGPRGWLHACVSFERVGELGEWQISGAFDEDFEARFSAVASGAGAVLKPPASARPMDFWLRRLYSDLITRRSKQLQLAQHDCAIIESLCAESATFCSRLEHQVIERSSETHVLVPAASDPPIKTSGHPPKLPPEFVTLAGRLWRDARQHGQSSVRGSCLAAIACSLDSAGYTPPAKYLAQSLAKAVKAFNSRNANSKIGPIQTWSDLVSYADKDHLRGMRKLLSRCASILPRNASSNQF